VPREEGGSQGLEKQEKVYSVPRLPILPLTAFLLVGVTVIVAGVAVPTHIYADQLAELIRGEPEEPTADPNSSAWRERPF
jgi:hypothetical protein